LSKTKQDLLISRGFLKVIAEHVERKVINQLIVGEIPKNSYKHPATWKRKPPEALHKTVNNHHCGYCNKDGHSEERCFKKKRDEREKPEKMSNLYVFMRQHRLLK
jgi:hypothetical protein